MEIPDAPAVADVARERRLSPGPGFCATLIELPRQNVWAVEKFLDETKEPLGVVSIQLRKSHLPSVSGTGRISPASHPSPQREHRDNPTGCAAMLVGESVAADSAFIGTTP
jgi:hypothetical protein